MSLTAPKYLSCRAEQLVVKMLIFFFPLTLKDLKKNQDLKSHVNSIRGVIYIKNLLNLSNDKGLLPFFFFLIYMLTILRIDITDEKIYHS